MATEVLRCFPNDDARFREVARGVFERFGPYDERVLQQSLRTAYPCAVVRRQVALASLNDGDLVWYVYRDGHYVAPAVAAPPQAIHGDAA